MKYTTYEYNLSRFNTDDYSYIKLPYETSGKTKVLFVLDHMPSEDMKSGKLLSGVTGDLLNSLISATKKLYANTSASFSWLAVTFNAFRTYGTQAEFRASAEEAFARRLSKLICKYKPDYVVAFGTPSMRALLGDTLVEDDRGRVKFSYWLGVPVAKKFKSGGETHSAKVVSNISLNDIVQGDSGEASLLGYMCKCLAPIFGKTYAIDSSTVLSKGVTYVDTFKKFERLMDILAEKEVVAIDTETKNLNKITNQLLTMQFAYNAEEAFLVPVAHKDSPFRPNEIKLIQGRMREYLEGANKNKYHIYANAKFDITLFRSECGVRYYANPIWDVLGGEFAHEENLKFLDSVIGEYYYSLGNIAVQYGFTGYLDAEFSKQHRAKFYAADLNDPEVRKYTGYDVVVPYAIHEVQKQRAIDSKYAGYEQVVLNEISDTIHAFSKMEHTGAGLDVDYLFFLRAENSPIEQEVKKMLDKLLETPAAKKANKLLANKAGMPTESMFGDTYQAQSALRLNKPEHRRIFFFDVLKLEPLAKGTSGVGKIDKKFQSTYAHVPEVAAYTALEKAKKLKNAYVKSFITMLGENEDLQKDHRIRPDFGYLTVVTHRTSARNPNLQQVPSHSALGKHIKRLFVARPGTLYVKVDYRVHEVRGWGLVAFDRAVAEVFAKAKALRDEYRARPTKELFKRLAFEADIHIVNVMYFFGNTMAELMADKDLRKKQRDAVKGVVFGLIYQMSIKMLAATIKRDVEFTEKLVANFKQRFKKGMAWIERVKQTARTTWFVEAPIKIRRHLWGYILPKSMEQANKVHADMDRRAVNSPVQGMCSKFMMNGIRLLDRSIFKQLLKDPEFQLYISNSVHDSLENEAGYASLLRSLGMIEWALTEGVKQLVKRRYGFELVSDLEIDFEIGATLSECAPWDFSVACLDTLVMDSLLFQRNKLGHKLDVTAAYRTIFSKRALAEDAPKWMKEQISNIGYRFELTEKEYIRGILRAGKEKIAEGEALLTSKDEDTVKGAKLKIEEGKDDVAYAQELNQFRHKYDG